jgi:tripartite-type tricarboxylate transporter receptor subunit TctC
MVRESYARRQAALTKARQIDNISTNKNAVPNSRTLTNARNCGAFPTTHHAGDNNMTPWIHTLRAAALAPLLALSLAAASASVQAAYPDRPIRIVVPYPPGGGADIMARLIGQKLTEAWGQAVVIDNRPGADTQIGTEAVAKSAADGYTLGIVTPTIAINKYLYPRAGYDMARDLRPVAMVASSPFFFVVNPSVEAKTLAEFIALVKRNPTTFNYSSSSSIAFIAHESFRKAVGIEARHIPYKGSAPSVAAVLSGEVQYTMDTLLITKPLIEGGKLRALAISSKQRHPDSPNIPTMDEAGAKGFEFFTWYGFVAPAAVPNDIVVKFNQEVVKILALPDVKKKIESLGGVVLSMPPEGFAAQLQSDLVKYGDIIRATNLAPMN